ncbi:transcriptional regulator, AraC family [Advenella mimigardefordensis DPN7]|uniref:Transcriptional regulator, AraC family n=2 Tax=Advenella mimigardefordensis TaxID=302406 RepID=W0PGW9_ADVMD|nr:GlxA family transcriptional regulator [Advenella mimigardefordensis]AHG65686.1 transcriptional regulator, AraC family [Advenella mimigardefordensis DPN7]
MKIAFYLFPDFQLLDLSGPHTAFQTASTCTAPSPYTISLLSATGGLITSSGGVSVLSDKLEDQAPDTLIICGGQGVNAVLADEIALQRLADTAATSRRIASVCTGAFILAQLGLLNQKRATTHWQQVARMQKVYPQVRMDGDRIFVRDGNIWTSAGITSGIDLALALIEQDCGTAVSRHVAQHMVVSQRRAGGQSQFSPILQMEPETARIRKTLDYAQAHLRDIRDIEQLADIACVSVRQFSRMFKAETGETPARAIERLRIEAARTRLESGAGNIQQIAAAVGFGTQERMRRAFIRWTGHPPQVIRRSMTATTRHGLKDRM